LDAAYLGLVSGDPQRDARSIRIFADAGVPLLLAGTFGKSFGLYGERVGILSVIAPSQGVKSGMQKQMILLARSETGASPSFGAKLVEIILKDKAIRKTWECDLANIATDLKRRRKGLKDELQLLGTPGNWDFLTDQVGMFS
jgi:aspartate aminotransferase